MNHASNNVTFEEQNVNKMTLYRGLNDWQLRSNVKDIKLYYRKKFLNKRMVNLNQHAFLEIPSQLWDTETISLGFRQNKVFPPECAWVYVKKSDTSSSKIINCKQSEYINPAGPVRLLAWCPNVSDDRQILVVYVSHSPPCHRLDLDPNENNDSIQMWDFGSCTQKQVKPRLLHRFEHRWGSILSMQWISPDEPNVESVQKYPYYNKESTTQQPLYGHILFCCTDGYMRICPLPKYSRDQLKNTDLKTLRFNPDYVLKLGLGHDYLNDSRASFGYPTCANWNSLFPGWLVAGYSTGHIGIFDLTCVNLFHYDFKHHYLISIHKRHLSYFPVTGISISPTNWQVFNYTVDSGDPSQCNFVYKFTERTLPLPVLESRTVIKTCIWPARADILVSVPDTNNTVDITSILSRKVVSIPIKGVLGIASFDIDNSLIIVLESGSLSKISFANHDILRYLMTTDQCPEGYAAPTNFHHYRLVTSEDSAGRKVLSLIDTSSQSGVNKLYDKNNSVKHAHINAIDINPNIGASGWVAVGFDCGLVHLLKMVDSDSNVTNIEDQFSASIKLSNEPQQIKVHIESLVPKPMKTNVRITPTSSSSSKKTDDSKVKSRKPKLEITNIPNLDTKKPLISEKLKENSRDTASIKRKDIISLDTPIALVPYYSDDDVSMEVPEVDVKNDGKVLTVERSKGKDFKNDGAIKTLDIAGPKSEELVQCHEPDKEGSEVHIGVIGGDPETSAEQLEKMDVCLSIPNEVIEEISTSCPVSLPDNVVEEVGVKLVDEVTQSSVLGVHKESRIQIIFDDSDLCVDYCDDFEEKGEISQPGHGLELAHDDVTVGDIVVKVVDATSDVGSKSLCNITGEDVEQGPIISVSRSLSQDDVNAKESLVEKVESVSEKVVDVVQKELTVSDKTNTCQTGIIREEIVVQTVKKKNETSTKTISDLKSGICKEISRDEMEIGKEEMSAGPASCPLNINIGSENIFDRINKSIIMPEKCDLSVMKQEDKGPDRGHSKHENRATVPNDPRKDAVKPFVKSNVAAKVGTSVTKTILKEEKAKMDERRERYLKFKSYLKIQDSSQGNATVDTKKGQDVVGKINDSETVTVMKTEADKVNNIETVAEKEEECTKNIQEVKTEILIFEGRTVVSTKSDEVHVEENNENVTYKRRDDTVMDVVSCKDIATAVVEVSILSTVDENESIMSNVSAVGNNDDTIAHIDSTSTQEEVMTRDVTTESKFTVEKEKGNSGASEEICVKEEADIIVENDQLLSVSATIGTTEDNIGDYVLINEKSKTFGNDMDLLQNVKETDSMIGSEDSRHEENLVNAELEYTSIDVKGVCIEMDKILEKDAFIEEKEACLGEKDVCIEEKDVHIKKKVTNIKGKYTSLEEITGIDEMDIFIEEKDTIHDKTAIGTYDKDGDTTEMLTSMVSVEDVDCIRDEIMYTGVDIVVVNISDDNVHTDGMIDVAGEIGWSVAMDGGTDGAAVVKNLVEQTMTVSCDEVDKAFEESGRKMFFEKEKIIENMAKEKAALVTKVEEQGAVTALGSLIDDDLKTRNTPGGDTRFCDAAITAVDIATNLREEVDKGVVSISPEVVTGSIRGEVVASSGSGHSTARLKGPREAEIRAMASDMQPSTSRKRCHGDVTPNAKSKRQKIQKDDSSSRIDNATFVGQALALKEVKTHSKDVRVQAERMTCEDVSVWLEKVDLHNELTKRPKKSSRGKKLVEGGSVVAADRIYSHKTDDLKLDSGRMKAKNEGRKDERNEEKKTERNEKEERMTARIETKKEERNDEMMTVRNEDKKAERNEGNKTEKHEEKEETMVARNETWKEERNDEMKMVRNEDKKAERNEKKPERSEDRKMVINEDRKERKTAKSEESKESLEEESREETDVVLEEQNMPIKKRGRLSKGAMSGETEEGQMIGEEMSAGSQVSGSTDETDRVALLGSKGRQRSRTTKRGIAEMMGSDDSFVDRGVDEPGLTDVKRSRLEEEAASSVVVEEETGRQSADTSIDEDQIQVVMDTSSSSKKSSGRRSQTSKAAKWWYTKRVVIQWTEGKFTGIQQTITGRLFDEQPIVGVISKVRWSKPTSQKKYPALVIEIMS